MLRLLALPLLLLLASCTTVERLPTDYAGADAGKVVIAIGASRGTTYSFYAFLFRRADGKQPQQTPSPFGAFTYYQTNVVHGMKPDYVAENEAGVVLVSSLPPGRYEIYNFDIFFNAGMVQNRYSSKVPFSIPFVVESGKVVYLGNYQANRSTGRNLVGMPMPAGAVFAVSDRQAADIAIARRKLSTVPADILDATPEIAKIANPFFVVPGAIAE